ncbi:MAG TPA: MBL fold metallo-hydrolase [Candidatus Polarisedimenticolia bacterium]|nr:MBL fold metallo-hydrolase [Candidatus Polarisedimenticolia bacterium]
MTTAPPDGVWTARDLLKRLERHEKFFVLDVRNREEFERLRIEGRERLPSVNVPYFEMLELGGKDEMEDSIVAYAERDLREHLPKDRPVLAVCAKGDTSEYVSRGLRRLGYACISLQGGMRSWGDHYATRAVVETADLAIYQVARPARGCLSYAVASEGRAVVIDPLRHLDPYLELARAKGFVIDAVLDTHGHADHISGGPGLAASTGASYYLHPYDAIHPMDLLPATISYEPLRDGQVLPVGRRRLTVMHIPGHTLGLVAFRLDDEFLCTGDSIFIRSIARPDLGGKAETWASLHGRSLRKLLALPGSMIILPGHFSGLDEAGESGLFAAPLSDLRSQNDGLLALQRQSEEGFVRYLVESLPKFIPEYVDIKRVNAGLLPPDEDQVSTLELGKNVCALSQAYGGPGGGGR